MKTMVGIAGKCKEDGSTGKCNGGSKLRSSQVTGRGSELLELDSRVELIQALIPLGLEAVNDLLQQEVTALAGQR